MFVYEEAWDYQGYLNSDLLEYKEKQEKIFEKIQLSNNSVAKIKDINKIVNLVVFAEIYCPDCRAIIPYVEKIRQLNSKINISIFPRKGNESYLLAHSAQGKIPTILMEDLRKGEEVFIPIYEEFPNFIKNELQNIESETGKSELVSNFRRGFSNEKLEEYLVNKILDILK